MSVRQTLSPWYTEHMIGSELELIHAIQGALGPTTEALAIFSARWLLPLVFLVTLVATLVEREPVARHRWREVWWSIGLAAVLCLFLSSAIGRERPFRENAELVRALIPPPASMHAFPSTHASLAWAWMSSVLSLDRTTVWLGGLVAVLVSLGRVVVGVHYPSDVLAGMVVGCMATALVQLGHRYTRRLLTPSSSV